MNNVLHFAREHGHLRIPPDILVKIEDVGNLRADQIVVMTTGSQGEPMSGLTRMSVRDHPKFSIDSGDTIVISATPIPGNEKSVYRTINNLYRLGATVIHGNEGRAHVSGHASQEELLLMLNLIRPEYFIPVHGEYRMLVTHGNLATKTGVHPESVFVIENGDIVEFTAEYGDKVGKTYGGMVLVDGTGLGEIGEAVLRDRKMLSNDGIVTAVVAVDAEEAQTIGVPDIVTRGAFYEPESEALVEHLRTHLSAMLATLSSDALRDTNSVREHVRATLAKEIFSRTRRRPVIVPIVIEA